MLLLYAFHRSTAAYRVRIALNYKEIQHELVSVNLNKGEQRAEPFAQLNPHGRVPTLVDGDVKIGQSAAIIEYLEEKYPLRPLLPPDIKSRAWVRFLSQIIVSDMHPIMNKSSVAAYLRTKEGFSDDQMKQWDFHWLQQGFDALEKLLSSHPDCGDFCFGETPTLADICLIPQVYNAHKFRYLMDKHPTLERIFSHCSTLPCFENAKPESQLDYQ